MTDADREYMQALFDMSEQIDLRCNSCCDICFQRQLCEAVVAMKSYVEKKTRKVQGEKKTWYFTFGIGSVQPFCGGWVEVAASSEKEAVMKFDAQYPPNNGLINCSMVYSEEEFEQTIIYRTGTNFGAGCHRVIE